MKPSARVIVGTIVSLGFAVWAIHVLGQRWGQLPRAELQPWMVIAGLVLAWAVVAVNSTLVEYTARRIGHGLGQVEAQRLGILVTLFNYFLPMRAGLALRLTRYVRVAKQDAVRLSAALLASALVVQAIGVLGLVSGLLAVRKLPAPLVVVGILALGAVLSAVVFTQWRPRSMDSAWARAVSRAHEGTRALLRSGPQPFAVLAVLAAVTLLLTAVRLQLVMGMLGQSPGFAAAVALAAGTGLSALVSVTFGGLGVREASIVIVGGYCGISPEVCLMLALGDRVLVSLALALLGLPLLLRASMHPEKK